MTAAALTTVSEARSGSGVDLLLSYRSQVKQRQQRESP